MIPEAGSPESAAAAVPVPGEPPTDVPTPSAGATGEPALRQVYVGDLSGGARLDLVFVDDSRSTRRFPDRESAELEAARLRAEHGLPPVRPQTSRRGQEPTGMRGPYRDGTRWRVVMFFAGGAESKRLFATEEQARIEMARLGVPVRAHARRPRPVAGVPPAPPEGSGHAHLARRALIAARAQFLFGARTGKSKSARKRRLARAEAFAARETAGVAAVEEALADGVLDVRTLSSEGLG
jgi:hypothetical protein